MKGLEEKDQAPSTVENTGNFGQCIQQLQVGHSSRPETHTTKLKT